jgi:hypothetical protein
MGRAVFKDLWQMQGRRPSPVEVEHKYRQLTSNQSYGLQNREEAVNFRETQTLRRTRRRAASALEPLEETPAPRKPEVPVRARKASIAALAKPKANMQAADISELGREPEVPATVSDQV